MASWLLVAALCCCCAVAARAALVGSPVGSLGGGGESSGSGGLGGGGGSTGGAAAQHRQPTTPPDECPATCFGFSCDDWVVGGDSSSVAGALCAQLERRFDCDCGGCVCAASAPRRGRQLMTFGGCVDTDNGVTDPYGDGCEYYDGAPGECGWYDDSDFSSDVMCCVCGGGSVSASPTNAPSFTASPTTSQAPTDSPEQATTCVQLRGPINSLASGGRVVVWVVNDITCPQELDLRFGSSVRLFGDPAASRPALSSGGATRLFLVGGATLELDHLALLDGVAHDDGGFGDGELIAGIILVAEGVLKLNDCLVSGGYAAFQVRVAGVACGRAMSASLYRVRHTCASRRPRARRGGVACAHPSISQRLHP